MQCKPRLKYDRAQCVTRQRKLTDSFEPLGLSQQKHGFISAVSFCCKKKKPANVDISSRSSGPQEPFVQHVAV